MDRILLATDLDDTLIGDDDAMKRLNEIATTLKNDTDMKLAYVTGRSLHLFNELKYEKALLTPDALVTAIGTEIYINDEKQADWPQAPDWNYQALKALLAKYQELELQPDSEQREYKLSYFLDENEALANTIREELSSYPVDVVYSMDRYFDILPKGVNKGSALQFLATKWNIESNDIYACGDSINDSSMLAKSKAIIVGNAKKELLDWASGQIDTTEVYIAKNSYANGIIEGLSHYGILS